MANFYGMATLSILIIHPQFLLIIQIKQYLCWLPMFLAYKDVHSINYLPSSLSGSGSPHSYSALSHDCPHLASAVYMLPSDLSYHWLL